MLFTSKKLLVLGILFILSIALSSCILLFPGLVPNDDYEPNDSFEEAKRIEVGEKVSAKVDATDKDYFKISLSSSKVYSISFYANGSDIPSDALQLYDQSPKKLLSTSKDVPNILPPYSGDFYIKVYGNSSMAYELEVDEISSSVEVEPNDDMGSANTLYLGEEKYGAIRSGYDKDYYEIYLTPDFYTIELSSIPPNTDYDLYLYNSNGVLLKSSRLSGNETETIQISITVGGYYYILVRPASSYDYNVIDPYKLIVYAGY